MGLLLIALWAATAVTLSAQCRNDGSNPEHLSIAAIPNRPSVSGPADVTQFGVLEAEYGWTRAWPGSGQRGNALGGSLRFGVLCDVELRWSSDYFFGVGDETGVRRGLGDAWSGVKYRFWRQSERLPAMAFSYGIKHPTASLRKGLGSGRADHTFAYLVSKDLGGLHADFNTVYLLAGRTGASGFDRSVQFALAASHAIKGPLSLTGEVYGNSRLNADTPAFGSTLWVLSYEITPRFVMDAAIEVGATSGAPRKRLMAGFTYSLGRVYRLK